MAHSSSLAEASYSSAACWPLSQGRPNLCRSANSGDPCTSTAANHNVGDEDDGEDESDCILAAGKAVRDLILCSPLNAARQPSHATRPAPIPSPPLLGFDAQAWVDEMKIVPVAGGRDDDKRSGPPQPGPAMLNPAELTRGMGTQGPYAASLVEAAAHEAAAGASLRTKENARGRDTPGTAGASRDLGGLAPVHGHAVRYVCSARNNSIDDKRGKIPRITAGLYCALCVCSAKTRLKIISRQPRPVLCAMCGVQENTELK